MSTVDLSCKNDGSAGLPSKRRPSLAAFAAAHNRHDEQVEKDRNKAGHGTHLALAEDGAEDLTASTLRFDPQR